MADLSSEATIDLGQEMAELRAKPNRHGAPQAKTLIKQDGLRVVLVALDAGGRMERHQAPGPITIHALDGRLLVRAEQRQTKLGPGQVLFVGAAAPHDVEALEPSAFLLTIGWPQEQR